MDSEVLDVVENIDWGSFDSSDIDDDWASNEEDSSDDLNWDTNEEDIDDLDWDDSDDSVSNEEEFSSDDNDDLDWEDSNDSDDSLDWEDSDGDGLASTDGEDSDNSNNDTDDLDWGEDESDDSLDWEDSDDDNLDSTDWDEDEGNGDSTEWDDSEDSSYSWDESEDEDQGNNDTDDIDWNEAEDEDSDELDWSEDESDDISDSSIDLDEGHVEDSINDADTFQESLSLAEIQANYGVDGLISDVMRGVSMRMGYVKLADIGQCAPVKKSRNTTCKGLTKSVGELSILSPLHVMVSESYQNWLDDGKEELDFPGVRYILLDGFRRVYAGLRNGVLEAPAVIWDFRDKKKGNDLSLILYLLLNKTERHSWSEVWDLFQIIEQKTVLTPNNLEYLLQLESGDSMKLKDIMLSDYPEVKEDLMSNKKTLAQAYNALQKLRKEEDRLSIEDSKGISDVEEAEDIILQEDEKPDSKRDLSDEEVREILEMNSDFSGDLSDDDFNEMVGADIADPRQTPGDRHPLDPALRAAVLVRDGYCCQVTHAGEGLPMELALSILNVHHKISVANGGPDTLENLITVSLDTHTLIHIIIRNGGKLNMKREDFDALPESKREELKKIISIARLDLEAGRRRGKTLEDFKKDNPHPSAFEMPGAVQSRNMKAIQEHGSSLDFKEGIDEE